MTELHTYTVCEKCGATVRASRHYAEDCKTILELRKALKALYELTKLALAQHFHDAHLA